MRKTTKSTNKTSSSQIKTENSKLTLKCVIEGIISGLYVGFINGFFGGGGGMLVVPILSYVFNLTEKESHATAIFTMLPICIASSVIYLINGKLDILQFAYVTIGFIIGGAIGALLLNKMNNKLIKIIFSIVMICAGLKIIL